MDEATSSWADGFNDDLCVGREANVETLEGRFVTGKVHRVWRTTDGTPIALMVGDALVPWAAVRTIKPHTPPQTFEEVFHPLQPGVQIVETVTPTVVTEEPLSVIPPVPPVVLPPPPARGVDATPLDG